MVEVAHRPCTIVLVSRARLHRLCPVSRRNRQPHYLCLCLAISADRVGYGRASYLCDQSAAPTLSSCNSRRGLHRHYRLQRLPDSKTCHKRRRKILHKLPHRSYLCACASRRGTECLRRGYSPFFVSRTAFPTTSQTCRATEVADQLEVWRRDRTFSKLT